MYGRDNIILIIYIQNDQKENKPKQALEIIGHVVAKSYENKRSMHGRRQFKVSKTLLYNK
jgi:hypothetical protein